MLKNIKNKIMKIGIDSRVGNEGGYYLEYVHSLIEAFCHLRSEDEIIVYTGRKSQLRAKIGALKNVTCKALKLKKEAVFSQSAIRKAYEKEQFSLMIFFDHHVPKGYKGEFYVMIESLKEIFFPKKQWLHRKIYTHKLLRSITKSKKVMVLDVGTALELNERLNIKEDIIEKVPGFFPKIETLNEPEIHIDIKTKHNIRGEYLIYDSGNEVHNNFERILRTIKKMKDKGIILSIIILCDATTKDLDIRSMALELEITDQILFLGSVSRELESSYYTQSKGVIFSSIYESFPFHFSKALSYGAAIFANEIPANKEVMGESIHYLDPLSIHNMSDTISQTLAGSTEKNLYSEIHQLYNSHTSSQKLSEIIDMKK